MSKHYTANQYDPAYQPKPLRNWEVPKYYCNKPRQRTGRTRIIANNVGRLLPGVPRPQTTPWGNFIGTWHLPRRIDRKLANILNESAELENKKEQCKLHIMGPPPPSDDDQVEKSPDEPTTTSEADANKVKTETEGESEQVRICPIHGPY